MGRPTDLSPEVQDAICVALREGCPRETAAGCAGVGKNTFYEWLKKGDAEDGPFREFRDAVEKALWDGIRSLLAIIRSGNQGWQGAAWMLERIHHETFGRRLAPEDRVAVESVHEQYAKMFAQPLRRGARKGA